VRATNTTSSCTSSLAAFDIEDQTNPPSVTSAQIVANTNCAGAVPNGSIRIEIDGGVPPVTDYAINWFVGMTTVTPLVPTVAGPLSAVSTAKRLSTCRPASTRLK
jgi:hypothetical protein